MSWMRAVVGSGVEEGEKGHPPGAGPRSWPYLSHFLLTDTLEVGEVGHFSHEEWKPRGLIYLLKVTKLVSCRAWIGWSSGLTSSSTHAFFLSSSSLLG